MMTSEDKEYNIDIVMGQKLRLSITISDSEDLEFVKRFIKEFILKKLEKQNSEGLLK